MGFGWWTSGSGGVGGRGRASTHGAFLWVGGLNRTKKVFFEFFGAGKGGVPGLFGAGRGGSLLGGVDRSGGRGGCPWLGGRWGLVVDFGLGRRRGQGQGKGVGVGVDRSGGSGSLSWGR